MGSQYPISQKLLTALLSSTLVSSPVMANGLDFVDITAKAQVAVSDTDAGGKQGEIIDADIGIGINLTEYLSAHFTAEFSKDREEWEDFLKEAYFVLDTNALGMPVIHAIRVGQQEIRNFGQQKKIVPVDEAHLLYKVEVEGRKVGAMFTLDEAMVMDLVDELSVSVYKQGDGSFMSTDGNTTVVAQAKKELQNIIIEGSKLGLQASVRNEFTDQGGDDRDISISADYTYERWNAYAQLIFMDNDNTHPDADLATNLGLAYQLTDNLAIGGDFARIDSEGKSKSSRNDYTGYLKWKAMSNLEFGVSVTRVDRENGNDETIPRVSATVTAAKQATGTLLSSKDKK